MSRLAVILLIALIGGCDSVESQVGPQQTAILGTWSRTYLDSKIELFLGQDGIYEINIEGLGEVRGSWDIDDRNLFSVDDFACSVIGIYEYGFEEGTLILTPVEDSCNRATFLDAQWIRSGPE